MSAPDDDFIIDEPDEPALVPLDDEGTEPWRSRLNDLTDLDEGMTSWECDFINDLDKLASDAEWSPTEKQEDCINRIWRQHCG